MYPEAEVVRDLLTNLLVAALMVVAAGIAHMSTRCSHWRRLRKPQ